MLALVYGYRARGTDSEQDWLLAEDSFKKYLDEVPDSPWAATDLSWVYFAQGKYEDMLPVLEKAIDHHPANPWVLNMYGLALLNTGSEMEAHSSFVAAKAAVDNLTPEEWGKSYPGNDPNSWSVGLNSFRQAVTDNLSLSQ